MKNKGLMVRFLELPKTLRRLIKEDMTTAFENRIKAMERINKK